MKVFAVFILFSLSALCAGCGNPINSQTADNYVLSAKDAVNSGDWASAKKYWARAITNAQLGRWDPDELAVLHYEYGRASGVVCDFAEAEKALTVSYGLDQQADGPSFKSLVELARLNLVQRKVSEAASYFERALPELEAKGTPVKDPIGFADILDEYSSILGNLGRTNEAREIAARAINVRSDNPEMSSKTDRTPYGKMCRTT